MGVFDREQRTRYEALARRLFSACRRIRELADGYAFELAGDADAFMAAAQWITLERICCPFLQFELSLPSGGNATLMLRGPAGVKVFLRGEFGSAWPPAPLEPTL